MKEHPILFSGEMVRAILDGKKTQTRRVIKPQLAGGYLGFVVERGRHWFKGESSSIEVKCPYGQPGDRLWVRETWQLLMPCTVSFGPGEDDWDWDSEEADGIPAELPVVGTLCYKANDPNTCNWWRPSIYMPRWASRITLKVVNVRVERVQEISEEDAKAEGILPYPDVGVGVNYLLPYRNLWESINARRGYGWSINPWVWVIEFKRIKP